MLPAPTELPLLITRVWFPTPKAPVVNVRRPLTVDVPLVMFTPLPLLILSGPNAIGLNTCAAVPMYSTVRLVNVLLLIVYCDEKSAVAAMRVTRAVPVPVSVPVPLITAAATGDKMAFAPLTLRVPLTARLLLSVSGFVTFESVKLKKVMLVPLLILCAPVPLNIYCARVAVERGANHWSRTNRQVAGDVHRAVIHVEGAAGNHHVSRSQRAARVVGPGAAGVDLDIAADGRVSAINVNGGRSRHTTSSAARGVSRERDAWSRTIQQQTRAADKNAAAAVAGR